MSHNSLRGKENYQEILLINGYDNVIDNDFEAYNRSANRMRKMSNGYFYNTENKNVYSNGTIEVGKRADLLLIEANPLDNVNNIKKLRGVMAAGRWYPKANLQERIALKQ